MKNIEINECLQANIIKLIEIAKDNNIPLQDNMTKTDILLKVLPYILNRQSVDNLVKYGKEHQIKVNKSQNKNTIVNIINDNICNCLHSSATPEIKFSDFYNLKYGRTCVYQYQSRYADTISAYTICPYCDEELYAIFSIYTERKAIKTAFKSCPKCKNKLDFDSDGRIENDEPLTIEKVFGELRDIKEKNIRTKYEKKYDDYIAKLNTDKKDSGNTNILKLPSLDELKQYLLYMINIESEIYLTKEYLVNLELKITNNEKTLLRAKKLLNYQITAFDKAKTYNLTGEIEKLEDQIKNPTKYTNILGRDLNITEPSKPIKPQIVDLNKPLPPAEPIYKKVYFFNKKKTLLLNEQLKIEYEKKLSAYNNQLQIFNDSQKKYEMDLVNYNSAIKQYKKDYNNFLLYRKKAVSESLEEKKNVLNSKIEERNLLLNSTNSASYESNLPQNQIKQFLVNEQKNTIKELKKIIDARNELYKYNIIYEKYRNYVALTTIYEYLASARCDSLEGINGAYNLYESELRSNEILNQLSKIVTSLDSIKSNQFMLYQELRKTNSILSDLSTSIDNAVNEISDCNSTLHKLDDTMNFIAVNSLITTIASVETANNSSITAHNSAVIAHNSAIAAHYSKVNANLTCALGFVHALQ